MYWFCKHTKIFIDFVNIRKRVRDNYALISISSCTQFSKAKIFPVSIVNFKIYEATTWQKTLAIRILPNISRISLCLYFVRYWVRYVLWLFVKQVCDILFLKLTLSGYPFFYLTKKPRQKFKYLENEKSS